jgi:GTPase
MSDTTPVTKFGHVAIIGRPNAGKSTLVNAILGAHLSIVTPKPQTTRKRVLGIYTDPEAQLVFFDTPGLLKPRYAMQRAMMGYVDESIAEAEIICVIVDVVKAVEHGSVLDPMVSAILKRHKRPTILVLNKMDALKIRKEALPLIEEARQSGIFAKAIAISAQEEKYVDDLIAMLKELAPEGHRLYDEDALSTQPERFFVAELIREVVFRRFEDEIPYATEIDIVEFKEREAGKWYIAADIIVERETQKGILIGAKGTALKAVGEEARAAIEDHLQHPVFLELFVKVRGAWRNDRTQLASFGY